MRFFTSKTKKLPRAARKGLLPRREFIAQGKERFLAAFDASALATNARPARAPYVTIFLKAGIGVFAALCVAVGVSAYADTANVPATSPLYPLKRISENVQLALAPASDKAQLQATFAVRRANEIAALQTSQPSSTLIPQLTVQLDQDISSSLGAIAPATATTPAENANGRGNGRGYWNVGAGTTSTSVSTSTTATTTVTAAIATTSTITSGSIEVYCGAFDVSTSGVLIGHLENTLALHPGAFAQFNEQCGNGDDANTNNSSAAAQPSSRGFQAQGNRGHYGGTGNAIVNGTTTAAVSSSLVHGHLGL